MIKKLCLLAILLGVLIYFPQTVAGVEIAITPGVQSAPYVPGTSYEFIFLIQSDPGRELNVQASGELAAYLELPMNSITLGPDGVMSIKVKLTVPQIDTPGKHSAELTISEKPVERLFGRPSGDVYAYAAVRAPIEVYVPCPDKCADVSFEIGRASCRERVYVTV